MQELEKIHYTQRAKLHKLREKNKKLEKEVDRLKNSVSAAAATSTSEQSASSPRMTSNPPSPPHSPPIADKDSSQIATDDPPSGVAANDEPEIKCEDSICSSPLQPKQPAEPLGKWTLCWFLMVLILNNGGGDRPSVHVVISSFSNVPNEQYKWLITISQTVCKCSHLYRIFSASAYNHHPLNVEKSHHTHARAVWFIIIIIQERIVLSSCNIQQTELLLIVLGECYVYLHIIYFLWKLVCFIN